MTPPGYWTRRSDRAGQLPNAANLTRTKTWFIICPDRREAGQGPPFRKLAKKSKASSKEGKQMGGTSPVKKEDVPVLKAVKPAVVHRVSAEDMAKKQREI